MSIDQYKSFAEDYSINLEVLDFGIYGPRYVFLGQPKNPFDRRGTWLNDPDEVVNFQTLFDKAWDAVKPMNTPDHRRPAAISDLFRLANKIYGARTAETESRSTSRDAPLVESGITIIETIKRWLATFGPGSV
jgi:hypothetical protein